MNIIIDPGHGGYDPGCVYNSLREKDINLSVSLILYAMLNDANIPVKLTRSIDVNPDFADRVRGTANANMFVSIHCNAHENKGAKGVEVWIRPNDEKAKLFAERLVTEISKVSLHSRGVKIADLSKGSDSNYYVLKYSYCSAVIVELGFLSNDNDAAILKDKVKQKECANAIAKVIIEMEGNKRMFKDVGERRWSRGAIEQAVKYGFLSGYPDGTFKPEVSLTREEFASAGVRIVALTYEQERLQNVQLKCYPQTVTVYGVGSIGSGVFIGERMILTNAHVVYKDSKVTIRTAQGLFKGVVDRLGMSWDSKGMPVVIDQRLMIDLALVHITEKAETAAEWRDGFPAVTFAPTMPAPLSLLVVLGSPLGFDSWGSMGVVSRVGQYFIGTDAAINPGNSGGGAFNLDCKFVGIPTEKYTGNWVDSMGSMIRSDVARKWIDGKISEI